MDRIRFGSILALVKFIELSSLNIRSLLTEN